MCYMDHIRNLSYSIEVRLARLDCLLLNNTSFDFDRIPTITNIGLSALACSAVVGLISTQRAIRQTCLGMNRSSFFFIFICAIYSLNGLLKFFFQEGREFFLRTYITMSEAISLPSGSARFWDLPYSRNNQQVERFVKYVDICATLLAVKHSRFSYKDILALRDGGGETLLSYVAKNSFLGPYYFKPLLKIGASHRLSTSTFPSSPQSSSIEDIEDKQSVHLIEKLMITLFKNDCFGHTLLGGKPISFWYNYVPIVPWAGRSNDQEMAALQQADVYEGWRTWEQYFGNRDFSKYIFKKFESDNQIVCGLMPKGFCIVLINKQAFLERVRDHEGDFRDVLRESFSTPEALLKACETQSFLDVLQNHKGLIGTLLGYGRDNSWVYYRRSQIAEQKKGGGPFLDFKTIQQENDDLEAHIEFFQNPVIDFVQNSVNVDRTLPNFALDSRHKESLENQKLRDTYFAENRIVQKLLTASPFPDAVFRKLLN